MSGIKSWLSTFCTVSPIYVLSSFIRWVFRKKTVRLRPWPLKASRSGCLSEFGVSCWLCLCFQERERETFFWPLFLGLKNISQRRGSKTWNFWTVFLNFRILLSLTVTIINNISHQRWPINGCSSSNSINDVVDEWKEPSANLSSIPFWSSVSLSKWCFSLSKVVIMSYVRFIR